MEWLKYEKDKGKIYIRLLRADTRWSGSWAKVIKTINENKSGGYAFEGQFIPMANRWAESREFEVKEGDVILVVQNEGSRKYHHKRAYIFTVENGEVKLIDKYNYEADFRKVMEKVKELLLNVKLKELRDMIEN